MTWALVTACALPEETELPVPDDELAAAASAHDEPVNSKESPEDDFKCAATADCWDGSPVSCMGGGTCTAVDSNCSIGQRGYVNCGSGTQYCQTCPVTDCRYDGVCSAHCYDDQDCVECVENSFCLSHSECGIGGYCSNKRCRCDII